MVAKLELEKRQRVKLVKIKDGGANLGLRFRYFRTVVAPRKKAENWVKYFA